MKLFYFRHNPKQPQAAIVREKILFYELTVVHSGTLAYTVNGEPVTLKEKDVIFLPKGCYRTRRKAADADYYSFNFLAEEDAPSLPLFIKGGCTADIFLLLLACDKMHADVQDSGCRQLTLILECILEQLSFHLRPPHKSTLSDAIKQYVEEHLGEQITIAQISGATYFSEDYCSMRFKKETVCSIVTYIISAKVKRAQELIFEGNSFARIAKQLGFSEYNYFSRVFKKYAGCTPTQYKKLFYT